MPIDRGPFNALVDDDGSNTVGSPWQKSAIQTVILDPVDKALLGRDFLSSPVSATGLLHNLVLMNPGVNTELTCFNMGTSTITGIAGGVYGQRVTVLALSTGTVELLHNTGSAAGNRFWNGATSGPTSLRSGLVTLPATGIPNQATYEYDGTQWVLVAHEQGAWITPPFSAANFTAPAGATWVVTGGDVTTLAYHLNSRLLHVTFGLATTTITGAPASVSMAIPGGFRSGPNGVVTPFNLLSGSGVWAGGLAQIPAFSPTINLSPYGGAWANGTDAIYMFGSLTLEVG